MKAVAIAVKRKDLDKVVDAIYGRDPERTREDEASDLFRRLRAEPPKQERSLRTLNRLLDAAERVLEEDGLDAATVPRIAKKAGVSVGVVYRRFPNKDALIRAIFERYIWRANEQNSLLLTTLSRVNLSVEGLMHALIRSSVEAYRRKGKLVTALHRYVQDDPVLKRRIAEIARATTSALTVLMMSHREKIKHPDPEEAIRFCVLTVGAVVRVVILDEDDTFTPEDLEQQLTRMIFEYLGLR